MAVTVFTNATLVLPGVLLRGASLLVENGRIAAIDWRPHTGDGVIDLGGLYLAPGFVDLHVHGGAGADFMDGTPEAFATVCRCHLRHGTTSLCPTLNCTRSRYVRTSHSAFSISGATVTASGITSASFTNRSAFAGAGIRNSWSG